MSSYGEEIVIVESNNRSFETNRLSSFKARLHRELSLWGEHEIALVDITLPYTIHNVKDGDYFTITRFAKKILLGIEKDIQELLKILTVMTTFWSTALKQLLPRVTIVQLIN